MAGIVDLAGRTTGVIKDEPRKRKPDATYSVESQNTGLRSALDAFGRRINEPQKPFQSLQRESLGSDSRFSDLTRGLASRARQRGQANTGTRLDALKRNLASMGGLNSGAGLKLQQQELERGQTQTEQGVQDAELTGLQTQLQKEESILGRNLQRDQLDFQRESQRASQKLAEFSTFAQTSLGLSNDEIARAQQRLSEDESRFNQAVARYEAANSGGLFGGGGFLGLGFGAPSLDQFLNGEL